MKRSNVTRLRTQGTARYQNRIGPCGDKLDESEALAYFPELERVGPLATNIRCGDRVLVAFGALRFWLRDVFESQEPDAYFGIVAEMLPPNDAGLDVSQCIGFELCNVIALERGVGPSKVDGG